MTRHDFNRPIRDQSQLVHISILSLYYLLILFLRTVYLPSLSPRPDRLSCPLFLAVFRSPAGTGHSCVSCLNPARGSATAPLLKRDMRHTYLQPNKNSHTAKTTHCTKSVSVKPETTLSLLCIYNKSLSSLLISMK